MKALSTQHSALSQATLNPCLQSRDLKKSRSLRAAAFSLDSASSLLYGFDDYYSNIDTTIIEQIISEENAFSAFFMWREQRFPISRLAGYIARVLIRLEAWVAGGRLRCSRNAEPLGWAVRHFNWAPINPRSLAALRGAVSFHLEAFCGRVIADC